MKKISTYLPSLIISVLLVFMLMASSVLILADINISADKIKKLAAKNNLEAKIYTEIEKNYADKYNTTGIPSDIYMDAIDASYIKSMEEAFIDAAFEALRNGKTMVVDYPENLRLEENIDIFFNDFADKNNYKKDEAFQTKLISTKDNAYQTISSFCDVYKFTAMNNHGVLSKLSILYSNRHIATAASIGATVFLIILLLAVNRRKNNETMYWCGISTLVAGIIGGIPSVYLVASRYFDSFTIKQPQVFIAFTGAMYKYMNAFIAVMIAFFVIGVSLVVIYGVIHDKKKYPDTKPTEIK